MNKLQHINCDILYDKIINKTQIYNKILKNKCITNSCKLYKEEILGDLLNLYKSLEYCSKK